jgi:hypothetical protein
MAAPIPLAAPVTTMILPFMLCSFFPIAKT